MTPIDMLSFMTKSVTHIEMGFGNCPKELIFGQFLQYADPKLAGFPRKNLPILGPHTVHVCRSILPTRVAQFYQVS